MQNDFKIKGKNDIKAWFKIKCYSPFYSALKPRVIAGGKKAIKHKIILKCCVIA